MPVYAYKGVTSGGRATKGSLTAETVRAARAKMRSEGIFLTEIDEARASGSDAAAPGGHDGRGVHEGRGGLLGRASMHINFDLIRRIPPMERAMATRQLATLVGAGIPLVEAMTALTEQVEHRRLKSVLNQVRERVNEGAALADAMAQTGHFDDLYVGMIRAGEAGGALEVVLERVADHLENQSRLQSKVTSILMYPAFMLLFAMVVVGALVTVVLPQITELLLSLDQPLPFYTRWIIGISDFMRSWWWAVAAGLIAVGFVLRALVRTQRGRVIFDRFRLRMPIFGRVTRLISIARFTRTLSTLLSGGVPIVRSLEIARHTANNTILAQAITEARESILEGATVSQPLRASGEFPPLVTHMIAVGEQSGELEKMLGKVADTYDEQVETTVTRVTSLMEPLLILVMVGIVLMIILAVLTPLLQVTSSIS